MDRYNYEDGVGERPKRAGKKKATDLRADAVRAEANWRNRPRGVQAVIPAALTHQGAPTLLTNRYREAGRPFTCRRYELTSGHRGYHIIDPWGNRIWRTAQTEREAQQIVAESNAAYGIDDTPW